MEYVTAQGVRMPAIGLGTYRLRGRECTETVQRALGMGYRHVDTAEYYDNQAAIGRALADAPVDREEVFLTTKVWRTDLRYDDCRRVARESVEKLGVDAVDLLLIHWPSRTVPVAETMEAMNDLQDEGVVEHVGVSNFSVDQLREAADASRTPVVANQVQYHPYHDQSDLLSFCLENDVALVAYSPLAKGRAVRDDLLAAIGDRYDKSAAQVALRWLVQQPGVAAVPKASDPEHLRANLEVFDFELADAEMERIFEQQGGLVGRLRDTLGL
ncbi:aldehyde oxidoreductase [Halobacteriales archaeon QS_1_68_17]|nr:MAG: aldehyde oxidoreductase [Halobacteriales archaeon QS_1_68_17]